MELEDQIDKLRLKFSGDLGFFPKTRIKRYIDDNQCLTVIEEELVAYLIHGKMKEGLPVSLTQLATTKPGKGLILFRQFIKKAKEHRCGAITIRCADKVRANWQALGFVKVGEYDVINTRKRKVFLFVLPLEKSIEDTIPRTYQHKRLIRIKNADSLFNPGGDKSD